MTLDVGKVLAQVRDEVARRTVGAPPAPVAPAPEFARTWAGSLPAIANKPEYALYDLLAYSDRAFVEAAYAAILRRTPDPQGLETHLSKLRQGTATKVEILAHLRWSPEGEARGVHVDGLLVPYTLQRWRRKRFVGPIVGWLHGVFRLGSYPSRLAWVESAQARETFSLAARVDALANELFLRLAGMDSESERAKSEQARANEAILQLDARLGADSKSAREELARTIADILTQLFDTRALVATNSAAQDAALRSAVDLAQKRIAEVSGAFETLATRGRKTTSIVAALTTELSRQRTTLDVQLANVEQQAGELAELRQHLLERNQHLDAQRVTQQHQASELASLRQHIAERSQELEAQRVAQEAEHRQAVEHVRRELDELSRVAEANRIAQVEQVNSLLPQIDRYRESLDRIGQSNSDNARELEAHRLVLDRINQAEVRRKQAERDLDPVYVAFEEKFRGSPELIRARALPYLDMVRDAQVGGLYTPILDIGCGRGDWLEVLREHGFKAHGVDSNEFFVKICRSRGLDVTAADVLDHLRSLPDGSQGAVTGMHIAEHLPFEVLMELLAECHRVLCIGGLLALETPNPENLNVATLGFYMDPTHRNPLPPEVLMWMVKSRGFERVDIQRWTVARELFAPPLLDEGVPGAASMNVLLSQLHAAPDYAVIARRL